MQKRILITLFLCLSSLVTLAQTDNSQVDEGSAYSQFGVGFPVDLSSSSADGMGLWGVSYIEPYVPGIANPAQWGSTVYGMATGGVGITNFNAEDNFGSARNSLLSVNQFQLQLPLYKNKLGVSVSFSPYSSTAFQVLDSGSRIIGSGATRDTLNFQTQNTGSGGVNRLELGFGWKINNTLSIGYAGSLVFASIDNEFQTIIDNDDDPTNADPFLPVSFTQQTSATGFGNRVGVYFSLPSVATENDRLSIGATINFPVDLSGERAQENIFESRDDDSETETDKTLAEGSIQLPLDITTGISYQPYNKMSFTTEALYQKWSNYENELSPAVNGVFADRFKIGAGFRYFPFVTGSDKFLSQFKYRLGASYDTGHLEISGENINTIMLSAGLGLLSPNSNSSIDLSLEYGFRGTKSQDLVKENIWGVKLSLNLAELFFFRPKLQ